MAQDRHPHGSGIILKRPRHRPASPDLAQELFREWVRETHINFIHTVYRTFKMHRPILRERVHDGGRLLPSSRFAWWFKDRGSTVMADQNRPHLPRVT